MGKALAAPALAASAAEASDRKNSSRKEKDIEKKRENLERKNKTKTMTKYIAYCRKSTDEKDKQIMSIEQQTEELKSFAQRENLEISEFLTEAETAKIPGRPVFNSLISLIEKGLINGIISWHPDRLARNSIDGGKIIYLVDTGKLQSLKFPSFWFENTPQGKFMFSIAFGQSKYYVDNLSENVKRGLYFKLRRGGWPSYAPLGYKNDRNTRSIIVDPKAAGL